MFIFPNLCRMLCCSIVAGLCACSPPDVQSPSNAQSNSATSRGEVEVKIDDRITEKTLTESPLVNAQASDGKYDDVPNGELIVYRTAAGQLEPDGWCAARATRGSFEVELPGKYRDQMIKGLGQNGAPGGVMHTVVTFTPSGAEFSVLQAEFLGDRPEDDVCQQLKGKFTKKGVDVELLDVVVDNRPARKLVAAHSTIAAEMVFLSVGSSDYMLSAQFPPALHAQLREDIDRFHNSFVVLDEDQ